MAELSKLTQAFKLLDEVSEVSIFHIQNALEVDSIFLTMYEGVPRIRLDLRFQGLPVSTPRDLWRPAPETPVRWCCAA